MFDPDWDPLDILLKLQHKINQAEHTLKQVAVAFNDRAEVIDRQTEMIVNLQTRLLELEKAVVNQQQEITRLKAGQRLLR